MEIGAHGGVGAAVMKRFGKVSQEEMQQRFPDLMEALDSPNAQYCLYCDGLRTHASEDCPSLRDCPKCGVHKFGHVVRFKDKAGNWGSSFLCGSCGHQEDVYE